MRLDSDDFELLGLPRLYALDPHELDERRRALQAAVHPDRHDAGDSVAQRVAMQWAVRVNEAHARLKDPLQRAAYLCELTGSAIRSLTVSAKVESVAPVRSAGPVAPKRALTVWVSSAKPPTHAWRKPSMKPTTTSAQPIKRVP